MTAWVAHDYLSVEDTAYIKIQPSRVWSANSRGYLHLRVQCPSLRREGVDANPFGEQPPSIILSSGKAYDVRLSRSDDLRSRYRKFIPDDWVIDIVYDNPPSESLVVNIKWASPCSFRRDDEVSGTSLYVGGESLDRVGASRFRLVICSEDAFHLFGVSSERGGKIDRFENLFLVPREDRWTASFR
jgi:hypothetical protein